MNIQDMLTLYDYNYWANRRILETCARVSREQFLTPPLHSVDSLRATLVHTMGGERAWRILYEHNTLRAFGELQEADFPTLEAVEQRWSEEEQAMRVYLGRLSDTDMTSIIRYTADGNKRERLLWHCLIHVINHGTQHRSEAAAMLTEYGASPGELDFTQFLNERAKPSA